MDQSQARQQDDSLLELAAGSMIGSHRLVKLLGEGGTGLAWQAESRAGEQILLKLYQDLRVHARDVARLKGVRDSPEESAVYLNILDSGTDTGRPWIAVELGQQSLDKLLEAGAPRAERGLHLVQSLLQIGVVIERHGQPHYDLKPGNIMVDREGRLRLIDPGHPRSERRAPSVEHSMISSAGGPGVFTPCYYPDRDADPRAADRRALGLIAIELLHGARLPQGKEFADCPRGLRAFLERATRIHGFESAEAMLAAFQALLAPRPMFGMARIANVLPLIFVLIVAGWIAADGIARWRHRRQVERIGALALHGELQRAREWLDRELQRRPGLAQQAGGVLHGMAWKEALEARKLVRAPRNPDWAGAARRLEHAAQLCELALRAGHPNADALRAALLAEKQRSRQWLSAREEQQ